MAHGRTLSNGSADNHHGATTRGGRTSHRGSALLSPHTARSAGGTATLRLPSAPRQRAGSADTFDVVSNASIASSRMTRRWSVEQRQQEEERRRKQQSHWRMYEKLYGGGDKFIPQDVLNQISNDVDQLLDKSYVPPSKPQRPPQVTVVPADRDASSKTMTLPSPPPVSSPESAPQGKASLIERKATLLLSSGREEVPDGGLKAHATIKLVKEEKDEPARQEHPVLQQSRVTLLENLQNLQEMSKTKQAVDEADNVSDRAVSIPSFASDEVGVDMAMWRLRKYLMQRFGSKEKAWEALEAASMSLSGMARGKEEPRMAGTLKNRDIMMAFSRLGIKLPYVCGYGRMKELMKEIDGDGSGYTTRDELLGADNDPSLKWMKHPPPGSYTKPPGGDRPEWVASKGLVGGMFHKHMGQVIAREIHEPSPKPPSVVQSDRRHGPLWQTSTKDWEEKMKLRDEQEAASKDGELDGCTFQPNVEKRKSPKLDKYGLKKPERWASRASARSQSPTSVRNRRRLMMFKELLQHESGTTFKPFVDDKSTKIATVLSKSGNSVHHRLNSAEKHDRLGHIADLEAAQAEHFTLRPQTDQEYEIHHDRTGAVFDRLHHHHHHAFWNTGPAQSPGHSSQRSSPRKGRSSPQSTLSMSDTRSHRFSQSTPALPTVDDDDDDDDGVHIIPGRRALLHTLQSVERWCTKVDKDYLWALRRQGSATSRLPDPPSATSPVFFDDEDSAELDDDLSPPPLLTDSPRAVPEPPETPAEPETTKGPAKKEKKQAVKAGSPKPKKKKMTPEQKKAWKMPVHQWVRTNTKELT